MSAPDQENSEDRLLDRLRPQALMARGLGPAAPTGASSFVGAAPAMRTLTELFPEFRFKKLLRCGGFGVVYRAEHRRMKREQAVKILSADCTRSLSAVARFEREIKAVGQLNHPGIVCAFDAGQRGGLWFLAMEFVDGLDFGALAQAVGRLPTAEACELIRQAAVALQHAHERGLIHRDVKPGNLMLAAVPAGPPVVKVLDFGLAQLAQGPGPGGELTVSSELLGTVDYAAPEQVDNPRMADVRADVYGLGATLYRLLTGRTPHQGAENDSSLYRKLLRITQETCPSVAVHCPNLPPGLVTVVDRMVARQPEHRFATAGAVAEALAPFAQAADLTVLLTRMPREVGVLPKEPSLPPRRLSRSSRRRIWAGTTALLAFVGALVFLLVEKPFGARLMSKAALPPTATFAGEVSLIQPRSFTLGADGTFYGGAVFGGDFGQGALYQFVAPTTVVARVHFTGTNGPAKGRIPGRALLRARDGLLYGVTQRGGRHDRGTVFRFDPGRAAEALTTLWEFSGVDGSDPLAGLIEDRDTAGVFYGGTQHGGADNAGTIFRITARANTPQELAVLAQLTGDSGAAPGRRLVSALAQTADGTLYGTTPQGGAVEGGTAFKLTRAGHFTSLVTFGQEPWRILNPTGGLTLGPDGNLYGHCHHEPGGQGAAFQLTPAGELKIIARFGGPHGVGPASTLLAAADGSFYGTTLAGGVDDLGTVFKLTPQGKLTTLASFTAGGGPRLTSTWPTPVFAPDGNLYGATELGGAARRGQFYRLTPAGELTMLVDFAQPALRKR